MRCIQCGWLEDKVIDSRVSRDGTCIRRRRECLRCNYRYTTYEQIERTELRVVKRDNMYEALDREKILRGMIKACEKRPVSLEQIDELARSVEMEVYNRFDPEVSSQVIGELVMERLKKLDEVAYVRFASVHRQFRDIQTLMDELGKLLNESVADNNSRSSEDIRANM